MDQPTHPPTHQPTRPEVEPTTILSLSKDNPPLHPGPVLNDNRSAERSRRSLDELIAIAQELGANVLHLPDTPITLTLTGPGVVILATPYNADSPFAIRHSPFADTLIR